MIEKDKIRTARRIFEKVYAEYHHKRFIVNDPLHWLHKYKDKSDREIVGLVSALLAFGSAKAFNAKIAEVLSLWHYPSQELLNDSSERIFASLQNFRHRFVDGQTVASLLCGIRRVIEEYGTIGKFFYLQFRKGDGNIWRALQEFTDELRRLSSSPLHFLLPDPGKGGACKRLHLFLRWMVREDEIDIGCWRFIKPTQLIIPLDTHIYQWAIALQLISPCSLNANTAIRLTDIFRQICPEDPLRYDFSLCQAGMLGLRDKILYDEGIKISR